MNFIRSRGLHYEWIRGSYHSVSEICLLPRRRVRRRVMVHSIENSSDYYSVVPHVGSSRSGDELVFPYRATHLCCVTSMMRGGVFRREDAASAPRATTYITRQCRSPPCPLPLLAISLPGGRLISGLSGKATARC
jgi:hypothetical protein